MTENDGEDAGTDQGLLTLRRPWPGMLRTLYGDHDRFIETYWDKFGRDVYFVGDAARKDDDGYFWIIGRVDDVLNVSGHRMSTAEIESAIVSHEKVAEAAVIGQQDEDSGQAVAAFVTLSGTQEGSDELVQEIRDHVAKKIGKLARPKRIIWADDLPKTRSGKIMRRLLRDIAEGRELGDVTTLRDPNVMQQLEGSQGAPGRGGLAGGAAPANVNGGWVGVGLSRVAGVVTWGALLPLSAHTRNRRLSGPRSAALNLLTSRR